METVKVVLVTLWELQRKASIFLTGRSVLDDYVSQATRSLVASILTPVVAFAISVLVAWLVARWLPVLWDKLLRAVAYVIVTLVAIVTGFIVFTLVVKYTEPPVTWLVDTLINYTMPSTPVPPPPPPIPMLDNPICPPWAWWPCEK
jgi:ABC-type dipeptide/oligopeptide/nickel transport system permease component